jgi:hypothetical protein
MEAGTQVPGNIVRELSLPIYQCKGWLKLIGILSILSGILTAVTLVGIIIAWLPVWTGVLLLQAASAIERSQHTGEKEILYRSLNKLKIYFIITGVLQAIGLIVAGIAMSMGMLGAILGSMDF